MDLWRVIWSGCRAALCALLRGAGPVPRHVAFIMDGNRRYAKRSGIQRSLGHEHVLPQFVEVVRWCLELGVPYVTVYAFSLENFKRSSHEVDELMHLAQQEYKRFKEVGLVKGYDAEVRVIGDLARTREKLQSAAAQLMLRSHKDQNRPVVHICFAYTASQEICRAVDVCQTQLEGEGEVQEEDLTRLCFTEDAPEVDLMIRTSGETRMSDFLTLQARNALLVFDEVMWPDYSFWHFLTAILKYSRHYEKLKSLHLSRTDPPAENRTRANRLSDASSSVCTEKCETKCEKREDSLMSEISNMAELRHSLQKLRQAWIYKHSKTG